MMKAELDLSLNTGFYRMQAALPYLKDSKGKTINFASGIGINGDVNQASYAAAKEAIRAITCVAANEFGITVNLISLTANSPGTQHWTKKS